MVAAFELGSCTLLAQADQQLGPLESLLANPLTFILVLGMLFYFMVLRPDRQKRSEHAQLLENLKKNDRVVTVGGIFGTVVNAQKGSDELVLKIDENSNARVRLLRSAISRVITAEDSEKSKETTS